MAGKDRRAKKLRPTNRRRKQQVQRFTDPEIQVLEELSAFIQETVDSYRDSSAQRIDGPLRASVYLRFGQSAGPIYYSLPAEFLYTIGVRGILVDPEGRFIWENHRQSLSLDSAAKRGRLLADAGAREFYRLGLVARRRPGKI